MFESVAQAISRNVILVDFSIFRPNKMWGGGRSWTAASAEGIVCNAHERTIYVGFKDETPQWPDTLVSSCRPHLFVFVSCVCGAFFHSRLENSL